MPTRCNHSATERIDTDRHQSSRRTVQKELPRHQTTRPDTERHESARTAVWGDVAEARAPRIAVLAGLAGGLAAAAWNSVLGEPVLGQAIKLEDASTVHLHAVAMTEPFTRREQQGGMVLGELLLGCGLGLLIAGTALVSGPRVIGPVRRGWLALVGVGAWSFLVLPAIAYPAMPPGPASSLSIDTRQLSYAALVCSGVLGAVLARIAWLRLDGRVRTVVVPAAFLLPPLLAVVLLPHEHSFTPIDHGLLVRFRLVAVGSQAVFWGLTAFAGVWLLDHRVAAAVRAARARLAR